MQALLRTVYSYSPPTRYILCLYTNGVSRHVSAAPCNHQGWRSPEYLQNHVSPFISLYTCTVLTGVDKIVHSWNSSLKYSVQPRCSLMSIGVLAVVWRRFHISTAHLTQSHRMSHDLVHFGPESGRCRFVHCYNVRTFRKRMLPSSSGHESQSGFKNSFDTEYTVLPLSNSRHVRL